MYLQYIKNLYYVMHKIVSKSCCLLYYNSTFAVINFLFKCSIVLVKGRVQCCWIISNSNHWNKLKVAHQLREITESSGFHLICKEPPLLVSRSVASQSIANETLNNTVFNMAFREGNSVSTRYNMISFEKKNLIHVRKVSLICMPRGN